MIFRTDLAKEAREIDENIKGVTGKDFTFEGVSGTEIVISDSVAAEKLGKKKGRYVSFETEAVLNRNVEEYISVSKAIGQEIKKMLSDIPKNKTVLVVGLGNEKMTADSIGPKTVKGVFVTRHIFEFLPREADERMKNVSAISPGVLGVTGLESADIVSGICKNADIGAIIVVDALAARRSERMFSTFQLTDTGIEPGAGVGNKRKGINKETLGIPVLAIGVPTVVYASSLIYDAAVEILSLATGKDERLVENAAKKIATKEDMVVTPKEIDVTVSDSAKIISDGINLALHQLSLNEISAYMF